MAFSNLFNIENLDTPGSLAITSSSFGVSRRRSSSTRQDRERYSSRCGTRSDRQGRAAAPRWQAITAAALLVGYGGYYVCRSDLSVVTPQLLSEFGSVGIDKASPGAAALVAIGSSAAIRSENIELGLLAAVAFLVLGPYSLLAGAIAVELGGRRGSATAAGLIDTAGHLGASRRAV
jgi:sugar phosphate permease